MLLAIAAIAPIVRYALVQSVNWTPLEVPLSAAAAATPREFTIDHSGAYELAVKIDRPADTAARTHAECLVGFDWVECADVAPVVGLRWRLESRDGTRTRCDDVPMHEGIVQGRSLGGRFTPVIVERWLGCFDAEAGSRYALRLEDVSDVAALESLNPRFVVLSSSTLDREQHSTTAAVCLAALLLAFAGFLVLFS